MVAGHGAEENTQTPGREDRRRPARSYDLCGRRQHHQERSAVSHAHESDDAREAVVVSDAQSDCRRRARLFISFPRAAPAVRASKESGSLRPGEESGVQRTRIATSARQAEATKLLLRRLSARPRQRRFRVVVFFARRFAGGRLAFARCAPVTRSSSASRLTRPSLTSTIGYDR